MKRNKSITSYVLFAISLFYLWLVWMHSVSVGRLDFDIFSNGGYKKVVIAIAGGVVLTVLDLYYNKRRKKASNTRKKEAKRNDE